MKIEFYEMVNLVFIIIGINGAHSHINQRITHAAVFPVNQFQASIQKKQEIVHTTVNVGNGLSIRLSPGSICWVLKPIVACVCTLTTGS